MCVKLLTLYAILSFVHASVAMAGMRCKYEAVEDLQRRISVNNAVTEGLERLNISIRTRMMRDASTNVDDIRQIIVNRIKIKEHAKISFEARKELYESCGILYK